MKRIIFFILFLFVQELLQARLPDLIPYRKGNLWGYADSTKKLIIPCRFQAADIFHGDSAYVKLNDQLGYVMSNGDFHRESYHYVFNWKCAIPNDSNGYHQIRPACIYVIITKENFCRCEGLSPVYDSVSSRYGYQNCDGKTVIRCKFLNAGEFSNGLAIVELNDSISGYINEKGKFIARFKYAVQLHDFFNGQAMVALQNGDAVIDKNGKFIIPPKSSEKITECGKYYIVANLFADKYDYVIMHKNGTLADNRKFEMIEDCGHDIFKIVYHEKINFLDQNLKEISLFWFRQSINYARFDWEYGLMPVSDYSGKWGFMDEQGKIEIPFKYEKPQWNPFWHEPECIWKMGNQGYVDIHGTEYWE
jgi:hypothetical protein